jgi:hypothetical protein
MPEQNIDFFKPLTTDNSFNKSFLFECKKTNPLVKKEKKKDIRQTTHFSFFLLHLEMQIFYF